MLTKKSYHGYEIWTSSAPVLYEDALKKMEEQRSAIEKNLAPPTLWLLSHFDIYTAGRLSKSEDLKASTSIPIYPVNRGGKLTYHGPGQLMGYCLVDLTRNNKDIHTFIQLIETYLMHLLEAFSVPALADRENVGIWTAPPLQKAKIASIGLHVRKWITSHGFSLNINPNLTHFKNIIPCGLKEAKITSLTQIHPSIKSEEVFKKAEDLAPVLLSPYG